MLPGAFCYVYLILAHSIQSFEIFDADNTNPARHSPHYFYPYEKGFVGYYGDPNNFQRERINEGAFETPTAAVMFYEGPSAQQVCPGMVGPFTDGSYFCTAREYGYCDRRSGTCFCNTGYQGIDCSECTPSYFKVGHICYPKKLCPDECSYAGTCDYWTGTCKCLAHRIGENCATMVCKALHPLCRSCTNTTCLLCASGYYLTSANDCSSCYDFDPRCASCTMDEGCTVCADPLLTSVRRSGYRISDPKLPLEEDIRELSITLPFGTKSPEAFADAETYFIATSATKPLHDQTISCNQGLYNDGNWTCKPYPSSHRVCGHYGVFHFQYPNYVINETSRFIQMTVIRSGGGVGGVTVEYYINHITTNDSDVTATAFYTTSQKLYFDPGVVQKSFLVTILDDNIVESNEVFQVVLRTPEGGGSLGAQYRTNVTIIDDDDDQLSVRMSHTLVNNVTAIANEEFSVKFLAKLANGQIDWTGGNIFYSIIENYFSFWQNNTFSSQPSIKQGQRQTSRKVCKISYLGEGVYSSSNKISEQGQHQLRVFHVFPGGLRGDYYNDGFLQNIVLTRIDPIVNFTWNDGPVLPKATDYVTVRWKGLIKTVSTTGNYYFKVNGDGRARLWIDGHLILDHWQDQRVWTQSPRVIFLSSNTLYEIRLEYGHVRGDAFMHLLWGISVSTLTVIPSTQLYSMYEINSSPVIIHIRSASTNPKTTESSGLGLRQGQSGMKSEFQFCPRDSFLNFRDDDDEFYLSTELFTANLTLISDLNHKGQGAEVVAVDIKYDHTIHCFLGSYTPTLAGIYELNLGFQEDTTGSQLTPMIASPSSPITPLLGSPFYVTVGTTETNGAYSQILGLPKPLLAEAGHCYRFSILARDSARNIQFHGGDNFEVYMTHLSVEGSVPRDSQGLTMFTNESTGSIKYGVVTDLNNGSYIAEICPVIAGWYEVHVLFHDPKRIEERLSSMSSQVIVFDGWNDENPADNAIPKGVMTLGQEVGDSPHRMYVTHTVVSITTSTYVPSDQGTGLDAATVGFPSAFMITCRDPWGNTVTTNSHPLLVQASITTSPSAAVQVYDLHNGSFRIQYTPIVSGNNLISVTVNGFPITHSPFTVYVQNGNTSVSYSYAFGDGLHTGIAGVKSFFQVYSFDTGNNLKTTTEDSYSFTVVGATTSIIGQMSPCPYPVPPQASPSLLSIDLSAVEVEACNYEKYPRPHYMGWFIPISAENITISVYLNTPSQKIELENSPFTVYVEPSPLLSGNLSVLTGIFYNWEAGKEAQLHIQAKDIFGNDMFQGGANIEVAVLGVSGEWGLVEPRNETSLPGQINKYYYKGFYAGYPDIYGQVTDNYDGSYSMSYMVENSGEYILRVAIAEKGLNATYFNTTSFGYLSDLQFNQRDFDLQRQGDAVNTGSTVSWTGDIGRRPGGKGDLGEGSYFHQFKTRIESNVDFNLTKQHFNWLQQTYQNTTNSIKELKKETSNAFPRDEKFRDQYWSARWTGMITPEFPEVYNFSVHVDSYSSVLLRIGGRGVGTNNSESGLVVINITYTPGLPTSSINDKYSKFTGIYDFTDKLPREFSLEYVHYTDESHLQLLWTSPSTLLNVIPEAAFTHWKNHSHHNLTIHPSHLSSSHSTAYGTSLQKATVGFLQSFLVYGRDRFGNLLQKGGDVPSLLAVGPHGVAFRGAVTDYGNSTYLMEYYPTTSGLFQMYVTIGCCPPHPNIGLSRELAMIKPLLISGSPFMLNISSGIIDPTRSVASGPGLVAGIAGRLLSFNLLYRDLHNNPTYVESLQNISQYLSVEFVNKNNGYRVETDYLSYNLSDRLISVTYNLSQAGDYHVYVGFRVDGTKNTINTGSEVEQEVITYFPTGMPTGQPSSRPTNQPTNHPSSQPSAHPSSQPSNQPSSQPSSQPTGQPSDQPTSHPSRPLSQPSGQPSGRPTGQPSSQPSNQPSTQPSGQPTSRPTSPTSKSPTVTPTRRPSTVPTSHPTDEYPAMILEATEPNQEIGFLTPIVAVVGSPFTVYIAPDEPTARTTFTDGPGLHQAVVNVISKFRVVLRDKYENSLVRGGRKFYCRLIGVAAEETVIPVCKDNLDGTYSCQYVATLPGKYELHIRLLRSSQPGPGGDGLRGEYFARPFSQDDSITLLSQSETDPVIRRVDADITFSWPSGLNQFISGNDSNLLLQPPNRNQYAIRWTGYIVPPINQIFYFGVRTDLLNCSIFIDNKLVFDAFDSIQTPVHMISSTAYEITIEASYSLQSVLYEYPKDFSFVWFTSSSGLKESIVSKFFLFSDAEEIYLSPFPVSVS